MRLMTLRAALFAADAELAASAPADPASDVQASAPQQQQIEDFPGPIAVPESDAPVTVLQDGSVTQEPPPVDNDHVAPGC
ncbi:MAG: hypothetical protein ACYDAE_25120 [Steroidobacteraceae bacterium]